MTKSEKTTITKNEFWTDEQIHQAAVVDWTGVLSQLWAAIGKPVNQSQLKVYKKQLGDLPLAALEAVVSGLLKEHTYNTVPTLAEVWSMVRKIYNTDDPEEITRRISENLVIYRFEQAEKV
jgi:hypothetical protein